MLFVYGMRLRPAGPGCQPTRYLLAFGKDIDFLGKGIDLDNYHDLLIYSLPLSDREVRDYELDYLGAIDKSTRDFKKYF